MQLNNISRLFFVRLDALRRSGRESSEKGRRRSEQETDFLLLFKCAIYKKIYWPLTLSRNIKNTFIVSRANTTNIPVFKCEVFSAVLQFLVCLDSTALCFLFFDMKFSFLFFGCGDMHNDILFFSQERTPACICAIINVVVASRGRLMLWWSRLKVTSEMSSLIWLDELCIGHFFLVIDTSTNFTATRKCELSHFQSSRVTSKPCLHRNLGWQWSAVVWVLRIVFIHVTSFPRPQPKNYSIHKNEYNKKRVSQFTRRAMIEKRRLESNVWCMQSNLHFAFLFHLRLLNRRQLDFLVFLLAYDMCFRLKTVAT